MRAEDLPERLLGLVRAAGADPSAPPPLVAWRSFVEVARSPVDGIPASFDLLVFESLARSGDGSRTVGAEFVRRMSVYADDDYVGSQVFSCTLLYEPTEVSPRFDRALVQRTRDELATFVTEVERSDAFTTLMALTPAQLTVRVDAG